MRAQCALNRGKTTPDRCALELATMSATTATYSSEQTQAMPFSSPVVPGLLMDMTIGGTAVGIATCFTNPLDVTKLRMQLSATEGRVVGIAATGIDIVRTEGVAALWTGLPPSLARGFLYGGIRLGMYGPIQDAMKTKGEGEKITFGGKLLAGSISGAAAAILTNPTDMARSLLPLLDSTSIFSAMTSLFHAVAWDLAFTTRVSVVFVFRAVVRGNSLCTLQRAVNLSLVRSASKLAAASRESLFSACTGIRSTPLLRLSSCASKC